VNAFQKRLALLEKWVPSLLPQLKDIDDMADIILDVWDEAEAHTEERIIKLLESQIHGCSGYDCDSCDDSSQIVDLIELIKGETNESR
jgi:hypothetical protein